MTKRTLHATILKQHFDYLDEYTLSKNCETRSHALRKILEQHQEKVGSE